MRNYPLLNAVNTLMHHPNGAKYSAPDTLHVGVDWGTAYIVMVVLDGNKQPLAGAHQFAQVVRDGLVVDYLGASAIVRDMKHTTRWSASIWWAAAQVLPEWGKWSKPSPALPPKFPRIRCL